MIGVTDTASAGAHLMRGTIVPEIAGPSALGSVVGTVVGARPLMSMSPDALRLVFSAVLLVLAAQMGLEAVGIRGSKIMTIEASAACDRLNGHLVRLLGLGSGASCRLMGAAMVLRVFGVSVQPILYSGAIGRSASSGVVRVFFEINCRPDRR